MGLVLFIKPSAVEFMKDMLYGFINVASMDIVIVVAFGLGACCATPNLLNIPGRNKTAMKAASPKITSANAR